MKKIAILLLSGMLLLTGCGTSTKLSHEEMCVKELDGEGKICYGMSRLEAEKIAGEGDKRAVGDVYRYEKGLTIKYRNNNVVLITLDHNSGNDYEQYPAGIKFDDPIDAVKKRYGKEFDTLNKKPEIIEYVYDMKNGKRVVDINEKRDPDFQKKVKEDPEKYLQYDVVARDGYISTLSFGDYLAFDGYIN